MTFARKLGWTALLIVLQPIKLFVSILAVIWAVAQDCGYEFARDVADIWRS